MTPGKRSLQAIFFPALYPREPISQQQTVLVIAREHATEPDSSWVAQGVIRTLLNTTPEVQGIRTQTNWIIIPIEDPDGSADAIFDRLTEAFKKTNDPPVPSEVLDYTRYFADYIAGGRTIDVAVSLHSVEANECPHLFCPFVDFGIPTQVTTINTHFFSAAQAAGFQTGAPGESWAYGIMSFRLYGWCANHYRTLDLAYEINSRYPAHRLSLSQTHRLGNLLVNTLTWWVSGDAGKDWHRKTWQIVEALRIRRQAYFKTLNRSPETRTPHELVNLGY